MILDVPNTPTDSWVWVDVFSIAVVIGAIAAVRAWFFIVPSSRAFQTQAPSL
jgi:hypothetical protein